MFFHKQDLAKRNVDCSFFVCNMVKQLRKFSGDKNLKHAYSNKYNLKG